MSFLRTLIAAALVLTAAEAAPQNAAVPVVDPVADAPAAEGRSPRNASYDIEVRLDPEARLLEGRQRVRWRNLQQQPTEELWFHLYWNAWRNDRSTWMQEDRYRGRSDRRGEIAEEDWGYLEVDSVTPRLATRYASPDDGNPDDRTVWVVTLPEPVEPGQTVEVELTWHAKIPRTFARTGFRGDYFFIAHWFPKLGVYEEQGWNCRQYHAATEYFSDYGVYDVAITLPAEFVLGATGREQARQENGDGTVTHRYRQEDVHAFTWTASPDYFEVEDRFEAAGLPAVDLRLLLQPEHRSQAERHLVATKAALERYGTWFGAYPYDHLTVVDPAWGSGAGGMEYPTLFTSGTRLFSPFGGGSPEGVTVHEAGHQFWYGVVGNNEFDQAWLDEGLNTYSTGRVMDVTYGDSFLVERYFRPPGVRSRGFFPWSFRDLRQSNVAAARRLEGYRRSARSDVPATPTYLYFPGSAGDISYSKTALWLGTLERHLGWETVRTILSTFYSRWAFRHPGPEDLLAIADEVTGRDLSWFFDQVHRGAAVFDYEVASVRSERVRERGLFDSTEGAGLVYREPPEETDQPTTYRSEAVVRRRGDGVFPVEVVLAFEDGSEIREHWDGAALWKTFAAEGPSKLVWAEVDPERVLLLDLDFTNNSRRLEERSKLPAAKWAAKWMVWLQDLLMVFGFFA